MAPIIAVDIQKEDGRTGAGFVPDEAGLLWQPVNNVDPDKSVFSIGVAAVMLEIHPRTLRIYENEKLIKPFRKGQRRYYSLNDIQWIMCLRSMIHDHGVSIAGLKRLLQYMACWNIVKCPLEKRKVCNAYNSSGIFPNS
ncbi:MAG: MerR family transcriptional regulator [Desulfobacteraceae bacterium]|nr:MerR family transcriptional regulator [Desulfobacteraceae bacterium]